MYAFKIDDLLKCINSFKRDGYEYLQIETDSYDDPDDIQSITISGLKENDLPSEDVVDAVELDDDLYSL